MFGYFGMKMCNLVSSGVTISISLFITNSAQSFKICFAWIYLLLYLEGVWWFKIDWIEGMICGLCCCCGCGTFWPADWNGGIIEVVGGNLSDITEGNTWLLGKFVWTIGIGTAAWVPLVGILIELTEGKVVEGKAVFEVDICDTDACDVLLKENTTLVK